MSYIITVRHNSIIGFYPCGSAAEARAVYADMLEDGRCPEDIVIYAEADVTMLDNED